MDSNVDARFKPKKKIEKGARGKYRKMT